MTKRKWQTNTYKLSVARKAQLPGSNIASIACAEDLPESTVRLLVKSIDKLESHAKTHGDIKALHSERTPTLTKLLRAFCKQTRTQIPPLPLTALSISLKGAMVSEKLLKEYQNHPTILVADESSTLKKMVFSTSWAADWAKRNNFVSKALHGEAGSVDRIAVADAIASLRVEVSKYDPENV